jgi:hypothetical protein
VSIEELGIDPAKLKWKPMPKSPPPAPETTVTPSDAIAEAKRRLAAIFGVSTDAVEITIRA